MPRHLRHHVPGGWYHITTRGLERRALFHTDRDREHFIELLDVMVERHRIILHAYVSMGNHYNKRTWRLCRHEHAVGVAGREAY